MTLDQLIEELKQIREAWGNVKVYCPPSSCPQCGHEHDNYKVTDVYANSSGVEIYAP